METIDKEGQTAQEVFEELKVRLSNIGYLPDEYFLLDQAWEDGRKIPEGADIFCSTDYGDGEGIYLDVYLKWYEDGEPITKSFLTGKTLGESGADLDRMFLISSAITKAFHGDHGTYARHAQLGGQAETQDRIVHLNPAEQRLLIDALVEQRERLMENVSGMEQLLRRMTGSITAYMNEVGQRPLQISDYDKTILAIQDGELTVFQDLYPKVLDQADELLVAAAGRPGAVGRKMALALVTDAEQIAPEAYLTACKRAVDTGDTQRVRMLMEQAEDHVPDLESSFCGQVIQYAYRSKKYIADDLILQAAPEQIAAAPPRLLFDAAMYGDFHNAFTLVEKGIHAAPQAAAILNTLIAGRNEWAAVHLLEQGMTVNLEDYAALHACIQNGGWKAARLLLEAGMDFEQYQMWAEGRDSLINSGELVALEDYWIDLHTEQMESNGPSMEMSL